MRSESRPTPPLPAARAPTPVVRRTLLLGSLALLPLVVGRSGPPATVTILPNDNVRPAGRYSKGTQVIDLRIRMGSWSPDRDRRPEPFILPAFAEGTGAPTIPGPMIRVPTGTRVHVRLRNELTDRSVLLHGLQAHPATAEDTIWIAPGASRDVDFNAGAPGTYFYWAAFDTTTIDNRAGLDAMLNGALIVDSPERAPTDRVFVIGLMDLDPDLIHSPPRPERFTVSINGRSWPYTERFQFAMGDTVRWRWINPTSNPHPMHLHGFYFDVHSRGTALADTLYSSQDTRKVVTERMDFGSTFTMTWVPERPGNWAMHCHIRAHTALDSTLGMKAPPRRGWPTGDMSGIILGIQVRGTPAEAPAVAAHALRLVLRERPGIKSDRLSTAARLSDPRWPADRAMPLYPGPPMVLTRGEPASITVVNQMSDTSILHWHGIELESYYDGIAGWSGTPGHTAPAIAPGDSFVARMTPPRAGTFIYHSHMQQTDQVGDGLYGPLIVLEPGERFDPSRELIWVIGGRDLINLDDLLVLNGVHAPPPIEVKAGERYRVRIINIAEGNTGDFALLDGDKPVEWRPTNKDGVPVPARLAVGGPATVRTSVGETFDFDFVPQESGDLRVEIRNGGDLQASQVVRVR